jgi:membrane-associated phospholipid phosphatase
VKALTGVLRPDGTTKDAFPSGHTAQVFMAATFLHKEFGRDHPLYSVLAYATATGVGVLRILNDRHWLSDVLVGAGVGILSTNLVYLTHQDKWGKHPTKYRATASPSFDHGSAGMYLRISFL